MKERGKGSRFLGVKKTPESPMSNRHPKTPATSGSGPFRVADLLRVCAFFSCLVGPTPAATGASPEQGFPLVSARGVADIRVAGNDWKVVHIAAGHLAEDIERVTGKKAAVKSTADGLGEVAVLIGTLGRSPLIDQLAAEGRLDVSDVRDQWETFVITEVEKPLPGVETALVIAGSDRRGTAYGVYEVSRRIGVSPWYWWADVTPEQKAEILLPPERLKIGPPAVKYRGIFINDEMWGIREWAEKNHAPEEGRGLGPKTHARIFELLLRLRANHLWPAMHVGTTPFNSYEENKVVADDYAIVMGSSHIEPMLRNNIAGAEWDREGGGEWNYFTNADAIRRYWERRLVANGRYENIYTLGMRGKDDEPMVGGDSLQEKIAVMERIFRDQRDLLARHVDPDPARVPQVFIPYTEVLGIYDNGLEVPEDVIICWPDDNFGYIRRLPTARENTRPGGSGIYYHIQWLNGATTAYTWLNTTPPALIWDQMNRAREFGANQLWVLNVGDIKPGEIGMEFFLDLAWDPRGWRHDNIREWLVAWASRDLDPRRAGEIAELMEEYYRLGFTRRPEHLVQFPKSGGDLQYSWFSHDHFNDEASIRMQRYAAIAEQAERIYAKMPAHRRDAFFQLVLYPVQCAALMNEKVISADKNRIDARKGRATAAEHARKARAAEKRILELTDHYNNTLETVGAKWRHMMSATPGPWGNQRHQFEMPPLSDFAGEGTPKLEIAPEGGTSGVVADFSVYTRGRRFIDLFNHGSGEIDWRATTPHEWIHLDATEGKFTTGKRIWIDIDWEKVPPGANIEGAIEFTSHAGSGRVRVPVFYPTSPNREELRGFIESHGYVSMEAEHFTRRSDARQASWRVVNGLGRSGHVVTVSPSNIPSLTTAELIRENAPSLEYDFHVFKSGEFPLEIDCLPTQPVAPGRGVRFAISLNDGPPRILGQDGGTPPGDVLANLRRWSTVLTVEKPGLHTLKIWMVDPCVVIDKLVLLTGERRESYGGPPESFRR
jgi:hypothetical protein